jgi:hypothetical protein
MRRVRKINYGVKSMMNLAKRCKNAVKSKNVEQIF